MATRPVKKTTAKKTTSRRTKSDRLLILESKMVPVDDLNVYHKNPRVGDVDAIAISLDQNEQYRAIVVNVGSKTGRPNEILAGNHTYLGARKRLTYRDADGHSCTKEAWPEIYASFVDVDETTAKKIVLADNKLADRGEYEDTILAELFAEIPDITGTGYSKEEVDDILANLPTDSEEAMKTLADFQADMPDSLDDEEERPSLRQQKMESESEEKRESARARGAARPAEETEEDKDIEDIDVSAELQVVLELKEDNIYKGENAWGVPELRLDAICEELPEPISTWGGHEATPDDGTTWWLYNYSLGGRKGLPVDRSIMTFFTHDDKFQNWWEMPAYYTARYMSEGLKYIIVPDFSFYYTETRAHHMWSVYKAQWMGRFFQEAGLKVIPRLQFDYTDPNTLEIALLGIPKNTPTLAMSMQNVESEKENGPKLTAILKEALDEINPGQVLYYSGPPGKRCMEATGWNGDVTYVENYAAVRRNTVFDKKDGKAKLTAKQRKQLIEKHGGDPKARKLKRRAQMTEDDLADEE